MIAAVSVVLMCLLLVAPVIHRATRENRENAKLYDQHGTAFYANVRPLTEDPATPVEVLRVLRVVGWCISNKRGPECLYRVFANSKDLLEFSDEDRRLRKTISEFLASREELERCYLAALWHGFLATSYRSVRYGSSIRNHLVGIETSERKQDVAFAIRSNADNSSSDDECRIMAAA